MAELHGLDLTGGAEAFAEVAAALAEHPLLVVRDQRLGPGDLVGIARRFGEPESYREPHPGYEEHPELAIYSNDAERGIVTRPYWHTDGLLRETPPELTLFYAAEVPRRGGDTLFLDARALYDELEPDDRTTLESLVAVFGTGTRHPLVTEHPRSGRKAMYTNLGATVGIVGVERGSAERLVGDLHRHYARPELVYRHRYRGGDLVIWENRAIAHSATEPAPPGERRLMLRADIRPPLLV